MGRTRERVELVPRQPDRALDLSLDEEVPGREVRLRDRAGVENGPLLGQVLARRQARRVVAGVDDLALCSAPEHCCNTIDQAQDRRSASTDTPVAQIPKGGCFAAASWFHKGPNAMALPIRVARRPRDFVGVRGPDSPRTSRQWSRTTSRRSGSARRARRFCSRRRRVSSRRSSSSGEESTTFCCSRNRASASVFARRYCARASRRSARSRVRSMHLSSLLGGGDGIPTTDYGVACRRAARRGDRAHDRATTSSRSCASAPGHHGSAGRSTIACSPRKLGSMPRAVDFEKGCYPGQEPIARQHYRGRVNRTLRVLEVEGRRVARVRRGARATTARSSVASRAPFPTEHVIVALGYVRVEVPGEAVLRLGTRSVRQLDSPTPRP